MVTLLKREKKGVTLTEDGESYMPFINALCNAENALYEKRNDMNRLKDATIRIGTFTSVSRNLLPLFMKNSSIPLRILANIFSPRLA